MKLVNYKIDIFSRYILSIYSRSILVSPINNPVAKIKISYYHYSHRENGGHSLGSNGANTLTEIPRKSCCDIESIVVARRGGWLRLSVVVVYQSGAIEGRHRKEWKRLKPFAELAILIDAFPADPTGRAKCFRAARRQRRPNPPFARPSNGPTVFQSVYRTTSNIADKTGRREEGRGVVGRATSRAIR